MKPITKALTAVLILPAFAAGAILAQYLPKEKAKEAPKPKAETKNAVKTNPLASYQWSAPTDTDTEQYRTAGTTLLSETIQSDASTALYEDWFQSLKGDDLRLAYEAILSAYRNSKGLAESAFDLSRFPSDDSYYDNDTLALKTNVSDAYQKDLSAGKYKTAYTEANSLTASLSAYVDQKTKEEAAKKAAEEEAKREAEEQAKKEAAEKALADAKAEVDAWYNAIPEPARTLFQNAGGTVTVSDQVTVPVQIIGASLTVGATARNEEALYEAVGGVLDQAKNLSNTEDFTAAYNEEHGNVTAVDSALSPAGTPADYVKQAFALSLLHTDTFTAFCPKTEALLKESWMS